MACARCGPGMLPSLGRGSEVLSCTAGMGIGGGHEGLSLSPLFLRNSLVRESQASRGSGCGAGCREVFIAVHSSTPG